MEPTAWIFSIQFEFWSPQLHQHLRLHSTCYLLPLPANHNPLMPLFCTLSFHSLSLLIRSSSVSAITSRSSAYKNSHGKVTLKLPWKSQIAKELIAIFGAYWPLPQNCYCYKHCSYKCFCTSIHSMTADTNHSSTPNLRLSLLSEPNQKLLPNPQSQNRASFLNSKLLLHLSYNKYFYKSKPLSPHNGNKTFLKIISAMCQT